MADRGCASFFFLATDGRKGVVAVHEQAAKISSAEGWPGPSTDGVRPLGDREVAWRLLRKPAVSGDVFGKNFRRL